MTKESSTKFDLKNKLASVDTPFAEVQKKIGEFTQSLVVFPFICRLQTTSLFSPCKYEATFFNVIIHYMSIAARLNSNNK